MRSIESDMFEDFKVRCMIRKDEDFDNNIEHKAKRDCEISDRCTDLYHSFHQNGIEYREDHNPLFKTIMDEAVKTTDFQNLKNATVGDDALSYHAMKEFLNKFDRILESVDPMANQMLKNINSEPDPEIRREALENLTKKVKKNGDDIRMALRGAMKQVEEEVEDAQFIILAAGKEPGFNEKVTFEEKTDILNQMKSNPNLRKIMLLAGREIRSALSKIQTKTSYDKDRLVGIKTGDEISELLPDEYALILRKELKPLFALKYINRTLMQFKYEGKDTLERGPIIVCKDESDSMDGNPYDFTTAYLFAMWEVSKSEKRPFHVVQFSSSIKSTEVKTKKDLMNICCNRLTGGTSFERALNEVVRILQSNSKFKKADCVFITDGADEVSQKVLNQIIEWKNKIGFKILGAVYGSDCFGGVGKFSDSTVDISSLEGREEMKEKSYKM